jgi:hypothetical protein
MNLLISRLDMKATKANWPVGMPFTPALVQAKQPGVPEDWVAVDARLAIDTPPSFAYTTNDQYVRIPLFEYTLSPKADVAFATILGFGLACATYIPKAVKTLHVVTGNPVDLISGEDINTAVGLNYWFGFAIATER